MRDLEEAVPDTPSIPLQQVSDDLDELPFVAYCGPSDAKTWETPGFDEAADRLMQIIRKKGILVYNMVPMTRGDRMSKRNRWHMKNDPDTAHHMYKGALPGSSRAYRRSIRKRCQGPRWRRTYSAPNGTCPSTPPSAHPHPSPSRLIPRARGGRPARHAASTSRRGRRQNEPRRRRGTRWAGRSPSSRGAEMVASEIPSKILERSE